MPHHNVFFFSMENFSVSPCIDDVLCCRIWEGAVSISCDVYAWHRRADAKSLHKTHQDEENFCFSQLLAWARSGSHPEGHQWQEVTSGQLARQWVQETLWAEYIRVFPESGVVVHAVDVIQNTRTFRNFAPSWKKQKENHRVTNSSSYARRREW